MEKPMDIRHLLPFLLLLVCGFLSTASGSEWVKGRYWFVVDNIQPEGKETPEIRLWVALPMAHRGQEVKIGKIDPSPVEVIEEKMNGNRIVFWRTADLKAGEKLVFTYDFEVLPAIVETDPASLKPVTYDKEGETYKRFTKSEPWIEITPEIKAKAAEIVGEEANPYAKAKRIFTWVLENMAYEYPDVSERGSAISFKKLKGDCGEYSVVFAALCRAAGIPARTVTCCWFTGSGHQWAEVWLPPNGWIPVDPSMADMLKPNTTVPFTEKEIEEFMKKRGIPVKDPMYLFGNLYPRRLIVWVGNNNDVVSKEDEFQRTFRVMQPGGGNAFPTSIEWKGIASKVVHAGFYVFGEKREDAEHAMKEAKKALAGAYFNAGLRDKAEEGFLLRVAEKEEDAEAWLNLGQIYMNQRKIDKAIEAYKKSIAGKAGSIKPVIEVWARNLLGVCYNLKGMREEAAKEFKAVIASGVNFKGAVDFAKKNLESLSGK
jgi:tetratricopeptide (TPR) repeat protein